jgi:hypothetical protein
MTARTARPFDRAQTYRGRGWPSFPLPPGSKYPPPPGFTGHDGVDATKAQITAWSAEPEHGNIGLRMPAGVIGIDVDQYDGKTGMSTLAELEAEHGALPPTYSATARDWSTGSRIRFYQVPPGRMWEESAGKDIEIIQRGHRYAVAPPSVHPKTGTIYAWYDPDGQPCTSVPHVPRLAFLPDAWVNLLDRGDAADRQGKAALSAAETVAGLGDYATPGDPCPCIRKVLDRASGLANGSRHDGSRNAQMAILRYGREGHPGAMAGLAELSGWFFGSVAGEDGRDGDTEWNRGLTGAVALLAADTSPRGDGCRDGRAEAAAIEAIMGPKAGGPIMADTPAHEIEFWDERPAFGHIRTAAHAYTAAPWAVLAVVLAEVLANVPPHVMLPPIGGPPGSLNMYVALVGESGAGKDSAITTGAKVVEFPGVSKRAEARDLGSGHGIEARFVGRKATGHGEYVNVTKTDRAIITITEIHTLKSSAGQQGSTVLPTLTKAWSGSPMGGAYKGADRDISVAAHSYRLCMIAGVQPLEAEILTRNDTLGLPQRFLWADATDAYVADMADAAVPDWPGPLKVMLPADALRDAFDVADSIDRPPPTPVEMTVCESYRREVNAGRRERMRPGYTGDPLDAHVMFVRCRAAAALALMDHRTEITEDDWRLSGVITSRSLRARAGVVAALGRREQSKADATDQAHARRETRADAAKHEAAVGRAMDRAVKVLTKRADWTSPSDLKRDAGPSYRNEIGEALDRLADQETITSRKTEKGEQFKIIDRGDKG